MMMSIKKNSLIIVAYLLAFTSAQASVVMQGNRVIVDPSARSQSIKFTNNDSFPYILQVWASANSNDAYSENVTSPFIVSPVVFRMQPHAEQMVNLIYTDVGKKYDREKIYYLHFNQVPSIPSGTTKDNKLVLLVNSNVKLFIRPADLPVAHADMYKYIDYKVAKQADSCVVTISNSSPYFLNSFLVSLVTKNKSDDFEKRVGMINPYSTLELNTSCSADYVNSRLSVSYVNDYGAVQSLVLNKK